MLFKRRNTQPLWKKTLNLIWPQMGWKRTFIYLKHRVLRLPHSTHDISMGLAAGCIVSWTPVFGFHILQCFVFCKIMRANFLASVLGTTFGNPWTFPFLLWISYQVGRIIINLFNNDYIDDTESSQASFYDAIIVLGDFIKLGIVDTVNSFAKIINLEDVFHFDMSDIPIKDLTNYFKVIFLPTLIGGYVMAFITYPAFYYGFYYLIQGARAAKAKVGQRVHVVVEKVQDIKEHRKEVKQAKQEMKQK